MRKHQAGHCPTNIGRTSSNKIITRPPYWRKKNVPNNNHNHSAARSSFFVHSVPTPIQYMADDTMSTPAAVKILILLAIFASDALCLFAGILIGGLWLHPLVTGLMQGFDHPKLRKNQPYLKG